MTDKDIIKALECLFGYVDCRKCSYSPRYKFPLCQQQVAKDAFDLVKHQQAEIEKLKIDLDAMRGAANSYKMHYEKAKEELDRIEEEHKYLKKELDKHDPFYFCSFGGCEGASDTCWEDCADSMYNVTRIEAIKEFAERLKNEMRLEDDCQYDCMNCYYECKEYVPIIDDLVKEMVGENNA